MRKRFFITGIGTDVGKTVVASVLSQALSADYWKPIQAGNLANSDSLNVANWTNTTTVLKEKFCLQLAESPHSAAKAQGTIIFPDFPIPQTENHLFIEGAGGLMVPINEHGTTWLNWIKMWDLPTIVVVKHYLGSINHSLLTINQLKQGHIPIAGIVVSGQSDLESERIIRKIARLDVRLHVPFMPTIDREAITHIAYLNRSTIRAWLLG